MHDVKKTFAEKNGIVGLYGREVYLLDLICPFLHPCNKISLEG